MITGFPTLVFFHEGKTYDYQYQRDVEMFHQFSRGGFTSIPEEHIKDIPKRHKGVAKYQAAFMATLGQFGNSIDNFFTKYHLTFVPRPVRYSVVGFFLLAPLLGMCIFLCFGEIEYDSPPAKNGSKVAAAAMKGGKAVEAKSSKAQKKNEKKKEEGGKDKDSKEEKEKVKEKEDDQKEKKD